MTPEDFEHCEWRFLRRRERYEKRIVTPAEAIAGAALGVYVNTDDGARGLETLSFGLNRFHVTEADFEFSVCYRAIESLEYPPKVAGASYVVVGLDGGTRLVVPVRGHDGHHLDAFPIGQFLVRSGHLSRLQVPAR